MIKEDSIRLCTESTANCDNSVSSVCVWGGGGGGGVIFSSLIDVICTITANLDNSEYIFPLFLGWIDPSGIMCTGMKNKY